MKRNDWLDNVVKTEGCWRWLLGHDKDGYPVKTIAYKQYRVSRLIYERLKGAIPDGMKVCHTCDNPSCLNPDHLFLGTTIDNSHDMMKKGRHPKSKLSEGDVIEIRKLYPTFSLFNIASRFCISTTLAYQIVNGKRKAWVKKADG